MINKVNIIWGDRNLEVTNFRNGDEIFHAKSTEEWENCGFNSIPAWCHCGGDSSFNSGYGKLYNWHAVVDSRGLAPEGWKIPNDSEWILFIGNHGGLQYAGENMKSEECWRDNGNGTNLSGFNGYPSGYRNSAGIYPKIGGMYEYGFWWSASEINATHARGYSLCNCLNGIFEVRGHKAEGLSVRCIMEY